MNRNFAFSILTVAMSVALNQAASADPLSGDTFGYENLVPGRFATASGVATTGEQVKAELADALRSGTIVSGDTFGYENLVPARFATASGVATTREQVKAELAEALRSGTIISGDAFGYENLVPARLSGTRFLATGNGGKSDARSMN
jgi:nucleoside phosphorylase